MALAYYYDAQIRRYLLQLERIFGNFQIFVGTDRKGAERFLRVPAVYGDSDRMAQHLKRNNSENTLTPVPFISFYITDVAIGNERRQNPNFVGTVQVSERNFDKDLNEYTEEAGKKFTVKRFMPVPLDLRITVDIWSTKTDHLLQLFEQITILFNPDINLQTSTNPIDWTMLTTLEIESVGWSSQGGVPEGIDEQLNITSLQFKLPIWLSPPAKVNRQKLIHTIIQDISAINLTTTDTFNTKGAFANILGVDEKGRTSLDIFFSDQQFELLDRQIITPGNHFIRVEGSTLTLLGPDQDENDPDGDLWNWRDLLDKFGEVQDGISRILLRPATDIEDTSFDFIGRITIDTVNVNKLTWGLDLETLPVDTVISVDAIIDPQRNEPGADLPIAIAGQRYIIANDIELSNEEKIVANEAEVGDFNSPTKAWGNLIARMDDIIEYNGVIWSVSFDASVETATKHTTNNFTGKKLEFTLDRGWIQVPDGVWSPGFWRIQI